MPCYTAIVTLLVSPRRGPPSMAGLFRRVWSDVIVGETRVRSVHEGSYGHKFDRAAAESVVAGGVEAGDRSGVIGAGQFGFGGCASLRGECEPGVWLAQTLSGGRAWAGQSDRSGAGPGDGHGGTVFRYIAGITCCGHDRDRTGRVSYSCGRRRRR